MNSKRIGLIISYINILLKIIFTIFLTSYLLKNLGAREYGIYKIINSFAGQLSIMSFGTSIIITRNIVYFNLKNDEKSKTNFLFMSIVISFLLMIFLFIVGIILYYFIDILYFKTFTIPELKKAKLLFLLMVFNLGISILGEVFIGIIRGNEKFVLQYSLETFSLVGRMLIIVILINLKIGLFAIIFGDLIINIFTIILKFFYCKIILKEKFKFFYWDKKLLKIVFSFSIATFLRAIVNQVNQNMDSIILGTMVSSDIVAMYSLGLTIFVTFNLLANNISSVFSPQATKLIYNNANIFDLMNFIIKPGRIQLIIAGGIIGGFTVLGKTFINLWVGEKYIEIYNIVLILIIPATIPIIISTANSLLDAKLLQMGRSIILIITSFVNIVLSIILIKTYGYIGAAIGTAFSYIIGYGIINNMYLNKVLGLKIYKIYIEIGRGILLSIIITVLCFIPFLFLKIENNIFYFILQLLIFSFIYFLSLYFCGLSQIEKKSYIIEPIQKIKEKLKII